MGSSELHFTLIIFISFKIIIITIKVVKFKRALSPVSFTWTKSGFARGFTYLAKTFYTFNLLNFINPKDH